ncbi:MAG TPA: pentapeptide repeat-containing protein [Blastocatellia bacterium]|nr:pentapeptide repeat-containing protein [Blastocatellia bacterium]
MKGDMRRSFIYSIIFCVLLLLFIVYFFWVSPNNHLDASRDSLTTKEFIELKNGIRTGLAQAIGGAAFLIGLYFTWRNVEIAQETAANNLKTAEDNFKTAQKSLRLSQETATNNFKTAQDALNLSREGQITERFTKAIEQLGSDKLQIQLGGIYALERVARDSETHYWPIMEVLTTYLREKARWKKDDDHKEHVRLDDRRASADVQAIMTVIGRRARTFGDGEQEPLNLSSTDLRYIRVEHAHLEGAVLCDAHLEWCVLNHAHLEKADLTGAVLRGSRLKDAHLEGSQLRGAYMEGGKFQRAFFAGAHVSAYLEDAILVETHLEGCKLQKSTGLTWDQVKWAIVDDTTQLPPELERRWKATRSDDRNLSKER